MVNNFEKISTLAEKNYSIKCDICKKFHPRSQTNQGFKNKKCFKCSERQKVGESGMIFIPAHLRIKAGLNAGDIIRLEVLENKTIVMCKYGM